jgi:hypothetical protein
VDTGASDAFGRTPAVLKVDEMNVNQRMVAEGHAWSSHTQWNQGPFVAEEKMATALERGLHGKPGAIAPWEWRQAEGPCGTGARAPGVPPARPVAAPRPLAEAAALRCDGRTYCSKARSCAEARCFLANGSGAKMDGNRDGVPCEMQWCGR